jgi:CheY-like chemotaxis protein
MNTEETSSEKSEIKILVVDDAKINRYIIIKFIGMFRKNLKIDEAANGNEAVKLSKEKDYDIVFMDIKMPGMDGIQASVEILKNKPYTNIYGITGSIEDANVKLAKKSGMLGCIGKPIDKRELNNILNKYC